MAKLCVGTYGLLCHFWAVLLMVSLGGGGGVFFWGSGALCSPSFASTLGAGVGLGGSVFGLDCSRIDASWWSASVSSSGIGVNADAGCGFLRARIISWESPMIWSFVKVSGSIIVLGYQTTVLLIRSAWGLTA